MADQGNRAEVFLSRYFNCFGNLPNTHKYKNRNYCFVQVTQFECGNMMAPDYNCLQYHTASSGTIASFNWDTSSTSVSSTQYHLSDQIYDICIRRASGKCSICFSPSIHSPSTGTASSYGVSTSKPNSNFCTLKHFP